jgi:hypothetical protein
LWPPQASRRSWNIAYRDEAFLVWAGSHHSIWTFT